MLNDNRERDVFDVPPERCLCRLIILLQHSRNSCTQRGADWGRIYGREAVPSIAI